MVRNLSVVVGVAVILVSCGSDRSGSEPVATTAVESIVVSTTTSVAASSTTVATSSTTVYAATTTTVPDTTTTTLSPIEDVESGLFCRDLASIGYDYRAAVTYWQREGSPLRMDADHNGIACETVYDEKDVLAFFGGSLPESVTFNAEEWVGRTVELENVGDDWYLRVEPDGPTFEFPYVHGPLAVPMEAYPAASGWIVAEEPIDLSSPMTSDGVLIWVVDSLEDRATILAALGLRLTPDRPLDFCWTDPPTQHVFVWAGPTHSWVIDEPPTYFQRVDRSSFRCNAG